MRVTFVYPGITDCGFGNPRGNEGTWIHHGLCSLSAVLRQAGHEVDLVDLRRLAGWEAVEDSLAGRRPDLFGITMNSVDFPAGLRCVRIAKAHHPEIPVAVGGVHPSILPGEIEPEAAADFIFEGEAELSLPALLDALGRGEKPGRRIRGEHPDLDRLPFADRGLFETPEEPFVEFLEPPFATLIAERGCRYSCRYCHPAEQMVFGRRARRPSVGRVMAEIEWLRETMRFRSLMFHDDCFTDDPEWAGDLTERYGLGGFDAPWVVQTRPDLVCRHRDLLGRMRQAGLALAIVGFESGSDRTLAYLRKGTTVEQNLEAARILHSLGIKIWANYMLGMPTETPAEQRATVDMIRRIRPYHCSPAFYTPHPGSDLFREAAEYSLLAGHEAYRRNLYTPKIRGVDYAYLEELLWESISYAEDKGAAGRIYRGSPMRIRAAARRVRRWIAGLVPAPRRPGGGRGGAPQGSTGPSIRSGSTAGLRSPS